MKEYRVRLIVKEYYTAHVFAEDEETAYMEAMSLLNSGDLEMDHGGLESEVYCEEG